MAPETLVATSRRAAELEKSLRRVIRGKDDAFASPWFPFSPKAIC